jgi:hypothetical protein
VIDRSGETPVATPPRRQAVEEAGQSSRSPHHRGGSIPAASPRPRHQHAPSPHFQETGIGTTKGTKWTKFQGVGSRVRSTLRMLESFLNLPRSPRNSADCVVTHLSSCLQQSLQVAAPTHSPSAKNGLQVEGDVPMWPIDATATSDLPRRSRPLHVMR